MGGRAARAPSFCEVERRFGNSLSGSRPHSPERSKKLQRPQSPRGERAVPSGYGEKSAFSLRARPKARGRGAPREPSTRESPGGAPAAAPPGTRGGGSPTPGARGPAAAPTQVSAASARPLFVPQVHGLRASEGAARHLPLELFPHGCKGSADGGGQADE